MTDSAAPSGKRKSLTKSQLETELGAELLSLCQTVSSDGQLTIEEVADLQEWLSSHSSDELPAIAHLRGVIERVVADGRVTEEELAEVYRALEAVLPLEFRKEARDARRSRVQSEREARKAAQAEDRQRTKEERERNRHIAIADFMVAGVRYEGRPSIIRRHVSEGDQAILRRDAGNRHSKYAIAVYTESGHQVGFMPNDEARDWAPEMDAGAQVRAVFKKVLDGGSSPIPVVYARLYRGEATLEPEKAATPTGSSWLIWLFLIVAVVVIARCAGG